MRTIRQTQDALNRGLRLAVLDTKVFYRNSLFGHLWLTLSTFALITVLTFVFGTKQGSVSEEYFFHVASGLVIWNWMSSLVLEIIQILDTNERLIRASRVYLQIMLFRVFFRLMVPFLLNLSVLVLARIVIGQYNLVFLLPFVLSLFTAGAFAVGLGLVGLRISLRFSDVDLAFKGVLSLMLFTAPIIWTPERLQYPGLLNLLALNPLFHVIRVPQSLLESGYAQPVSVLASIASALLLLAIGIVISRKLLFFFWRNPR